MSQEFPREAVPLEHANRSPVSIAMIMSGMLMGVPMIILGGAIGRDYGLVNAAIVIAAGCGLSAVLAMLTAYAGARTRLSTALLSEQAFGRQGARALTAALGIALVGWVAVEMGFIGEFAVGGFRRALGVEVPLAVAIIVATTTIALITIFGIALISRVPLVFVPLLLLLLGFVVITAVPRLEVTGPVSSVAVPLGTGISAIIGSFIIGCIVQPDYSRFIRRPRDAMVAVGVSLGPIWMIIIGGYAAAGLVAQSNDAAEVLIMLGMPAALTILLPLGLTQNGIVTLYSSALVNATWLRGISFTWLVIATSAISALMALAGAQEAFVSYLVLLGLVFPPAAAILVQEALFGTAQSTNVRWHTLAIWLLGSGAATLSEYKVGITGISALDGFIVAFALSFAWTRWRAAPQREKLEKTPLPPGEGQG